MKKLSFFLLFITLTLSVKAQTYSFQINSVLYSLDLISLTTSTDPDRYDYIWQFEFQYAINNYFNISLEPQFGIRKGLMEPYSDNESYSKNTSILLLSAVLFRPFGSRLKGMYVGVYPVTGWRNWKSDNSSDNYAVFGYGFLSGYQWIFKNGFTLSLGGGLQREWIVKPGTKPARTSFLLGNNTLFDERPIFDIKMDIKLGYSF